MSSATFLRGSVGSFSRGGLMVTHEGRVIYKINQDRGLISHPNLNTARHAVFGVFDGHGENGEHVAAYAMREVPRRLELHPDSSRDPVSALEDVFLAINSSLPKSGINAVFGGCTAVVALVRGTRVWVANAGDSRALVAGRGKDGSVVARGLTRDQNPDSPGERERIEAMGGFVSDPEEEGASARVWLDETRTLVGLAMARSIGDLAVKRVGVIALPEVTEYVLAPEDEFLVLASDGVWEFIDNQEASEIVQGFFDRGEDAAGACKGLMEHANRRWSDMVGDYRDDITATVVKLPFLPPKAAAEALAMDAASTDNDDSGGIEKEAAGHAASSEAAPPPSGDPSVISSSQEREELTNRADSVVAGNASPAEAQTPSVVATAVPGGGSSGAGDDGGDVGSGLVLTAKVGEDKEQEGLGHSAGAPAAMAAAAGDRDDGAVEDEEIKGRAATAAVTPEDFSEDDVEARRKDERGEGGGDQRVDGGVGGGREGVRDETKRVSVSSAIPEALTAINKQAKADPNGRAALPLVPSFIPGMSAAAAAAAAAAPRTSDTTTTDEAGASTHEAAKVFVNTGGVGEEGLEGEQELEQEEEEEWEWDFGARENREPSREIREASREFPSCSLDALVAGADGPSFRRA